MEEYRVRIRGVEVIVNSLDALDEIIERYAEQAPSESGDTVRARVSDDRAGESTPHSLDRALLKRFIDAEDIGISSRELAVKLHANRKAVQVGLKAWADRVGLWHGNFQAIFVKQIRSGARGYRLTEEAISAGRDILGIE